MDAPKFTDLQTQGESKSDTLTLTLEKPGPHDRLVGVVELSPGGPGSRKVFAIDSVRPSVNPEKGGASDTKQPSGG
jgi:hypothetical protein